MFRRRTVNQNHQELQRELSYLAELESDGRLVDYLSSWGEQGEPGVACSCVLANHLWRRLGVDVEVSYRLTKDPARLQLLDAGGNSLAEVPKSLAKFLELFDAGKFPELLEPPPRVNTFEHAEVDFTKEKTCQRCGRRVFVVPTRFGDISLNEMTSPWSAHECNTHPDWGVIQEAVRDGTNRFGVVTSVETVSGKTPYYWTRWSDGTLGGEYWEPGDPAREPDQDVGRLVYVVGSAVYLKSNKGADTSLPRLPLSNQFDGFVVEMAVDFFRERKVLGLAELIDGYEEWSGSLFRYQEAVAALFELTKRTLLFIATVNDEPILLPTPAGTKMVDERLN